MPNQAKFMIRVAVKIDGKIIMLGKMVFIANEVR